MRYICSICGYVYDEANEKTPFTDLPASWTCPLCGAVRALFSPEEKPAQTAANETPNQPDGSRPPGPDLSQTPDGDRKQIPDSDRKQLSDGDLRQLSDGDLRQLSDGVLAALCTNLARGCEKQYKEEEAALFRELGDYFTAAAAQREGGGLEELLALLEADLENGYPAVRGAAQECGDRGTLRVCTWGEKVTHILQSLAQRCQKEGPAFLAGTQIWVCSVCGFVFVGEAPPELCPVCKVPAWKFDRIEGRTSA